MYGILDGAMLGNSIESRILLGDSFVVIELIQSYLTLLSLPPFIYHSSFFFLSNPQDRNDDMCRE